MDDFSKSKDVIENISTKLLVNFAKTGSLIDGVFNQYYKKFGVSRPQFTALYLIYVEGQNGISLSILGDRMYVTRANITTLIDRMESRGLIQRSMNQRDRRSVKALITEKGRHLLTEILATHKLFTWEMLDFLSEREKERANEILEKIQKELVDKDL